jgi:hypothetical protein
MPFASYLKSGSMLFLDAKHRLACLISRELRAPMKVQFLLNSREPIEAVLICADAPSAINAETVHPSA